MSENVDEPVLLSRGEIHRRIEALSLSADTKALLMDLAERAQKVGGRLIEVGRAVLSWAFDLINRYPNTSFGAIVALIMSSLIASVPVLGAVIAPLLKPLLLAIGIGMGALTDLRTASIDARLDAIAEKANGWVASR